MMTGPAYTPHPIADSVANLCTQLIDQYTVDAETNIAAYSDSQHFDMAESHAKIAAYKEQVKEICEKVAALEARR